MMNVLLTILLFLLTLFFGVFVIMFVIIPVGLFMFSVACKFYSWIFDMFGL